MEDTQIFLAEQIFRLTCLKNGYDLADVEERLTPDFWEFLVVASRLIHNVVGDEPADVIETYACGFSHDKEIREGLFNESEKLREKKQSVFKNA